VGKGETATDLREFTRCVWGCDRGCKHSDAWKCAVERRLTDRIACGCDCHNYVRTALKAGNK